VGDGRGLLRHGVQVSFVHRRTMIARGGTRSEEGRPRGAAAAPSGSR
jgi:hypothetical protein